MFGYAPAVIASYPTIRAGVVHATGVSNGPSPKPLWDAFVAEQHTVAERLHTTPIAEHPSIAAWRRAFTRFGTKPTQSRNAAEALLRRLAKRGELPSINTLVDIANLVSIRYALPVAVFDRAGIAGAISVRFATGSEPFTDLGAHEPVHPDPGEVIFVDAAGVAVARRWCWRQSEHSATAAATTEALWVVEGHHDTAESDIELAVSDLASLLATHQRHSLTRIYRLSPTTPHIHPTSDDDSPGH